MNYIATWLYADQAGEESLFPQTGKLSSSEEHLLIYWRCVITFFITSRKFNPDHSHLFFTNVKDLPRYDNCNVADILAELSVQVIHAEFNYKLPAGYYKSFQNQFYEFSILEYISTRMSTADDDLFLILDADCVCLKPVDPLFAAAGAAGNFISFKDDVAPDYVINGLSRLDMKQLYEELTGVKVDEIPAYHLGEFYLASARHTRTIYHDFLQLYPILLQRQQQGQLRFNEEAHTLSYLYYKNGFRPAIDNNFMKRIWTNPVFYRNVEETDPELIIWHLPAEKTFGLKKLYDLLLATPAFGLDIPSDDFANILQRVFGIPNLSITMRLQYYTLSYVRAIRKRIKRKVSKSISR